MNGRPPAPKAGALPACATPRGFGRPPVSIALAAWRVKAWYHGTMNLGPMEIILILLIILLLFGAKKLPELARGIGQAAREFKKGIQEEEKKEEPKA